MTSPASKRGHPDLKGDFALWLGLLGAPVAWAFHLEIIYALVPWICKHGGVFWLHVATAVFLLIAAACALVSWHSWKHPVRDDDLAPPEVVEQRSRFMAMVGLLASVLFFLLILAQGIPSFLISPCQD